MNTSSEKSGAVQQQEGSNGNPGKDRKLPFWKMMLSVLQASFGVQNKANKERDFEQGSVGGFIAAAIIFTFIFVMTLLLIVRVVLS